jgi:signal peptidase I
MNNLFKENRGLIVFFLCLAFFRTAVADWNPIPTGSMRPNLQEGDVVFVNRLAYDFKLPLTDIVIAQLADPKRGDIVTFTSPKDGMRLIKRIIALPGDKIEMRNEVLLINGKAATYRDQDALLEPLANGDAVNAVQVTEVIEKSKRRVQWLVGVSARNTFGPMQVPSGKYLMLGDNRDNSADSRYFGFVPRQLLIGKAERILVSVDMLGNWLPRAERFGQKLQ